MKEIDCIFCRIPSNQSIIQENGFTAKKCRKCGLIFLSPQPSPVEVFNLYGHDNAHVKADSHISEEFLKRLYAKHHLNIIKPYSHGGRILEIGAGAGFFLDEARKMGFDPYGLEFNPIQARYIRDTLRIPCEEKPLGSDVFGGIHFDVVFHCDVISHFFDPVSDFRRINSSLKRGGYLIFETGNLGEVDSKFFPYFERFQLPDHLFFFSVRNLIDLLENTGFECKKVLRYSILPQLWTTQTLTAIQQTAGKWFGLGKKESLPVTGEPRNFSINPGESSETWMKTSIKGFLRSAFRYLMYGLRYKIGRLAPKTNRPQTIIVVAKKKI